MHLAAKESSMKSWAPVLILLLLAMPLAITACGDGDAAPDVTTDDLAAMALTKEELGGKFAEVNLDSAESGPQPNDTFLEGFEDPGEGRRFIDDYGRVTGYDLVFQGEALIAQSLSVYETPAGAGDAIAVLFDEVEQVPGIELEEFDAGVIADESRAMIMRQAGAALSALVLLRIEEISVLVAVTVSEASPLSDEAALRNDAGDLARKLADKVHAALID